MGRATEKRRYNMASRAAAAAHTRTRILEAAGELFRTQLYDNVTLQKMADAAGVSLPTVLNYFGSKEGVVAAVPEYFRPKEMAARQVPPGDVEAAARVICGRYEELGPMTMRMLALEERIAALRPLLDAGRAGHREWVETTFAATIRRARRGPARERLTMQLVVATDLYGWSVLRRSLGPEDTVRAMADMLWAIVERRPKGVKR